MLQWFLIVPITQVEMCSVRTFLRFVLPSTQKTGLFFILLASPERNKQTERTLAGTPKQMWPITADPDSTN